MKNTKTHQCTLFMDQAQLAFCGTINFLMSKSHFFNYAIDNSFMTQVVAANENKHEWERIKTSDNLLLHESFSCGLHPTYLVQYVQLSDARLFSNCLLSTSAGFVARKLSKQQNYLQRLIVIVTKFQALDSALKKIISSLYSRQYAEAVFFFKVLVI